MTYVLTFAISGFLFFLGEKCRGLLKGLLVAAALVLPCILASFRDETVGVDILVYGNWMFQNASALSFPDFMESARAIAAPGWNAFTWLTVNATSSMEGYLFCIEALCVVPVYIALRRISPNAVTAGMLVWFLVFYAFSLNAMRQCAAMGIAAIAVSFMLERKPLPFAVGVFAAFLIHQTAAICILLYPYMLFIGKHGKSSSLFGKWHGVIIAIATVLVLALTFVFGESLFESLSVFKDSYAGLTNEFGNGDLSMTGLILLIGSAASWMSGRCALSGNLEQPGGDREVVKLLERFDLACTVSTVGAILLQLSIITAALGRLGNYGVMFFPLAVSMLSGRNGGSNNSMVFAVLFAALYFVVGTLILGQSGVMPYTSSILGIR